MTPRQANVLILAVSALLLLIAAVSAFADEPRPLRPDARLTPGVVLASGVSIAGVCTSGYSKSVRHVTTSTKRLVFARYAITPSGAYEVDHLISLELGGSNDVGNLWPQSYLTTPYNARKKDALENRLHWLVCHRALSLAAAQRAIATDWIAAYRHFVVESAVR